MTTEGPITGMAGATAPQWAAVAAAEAEVPVADRVLALLRLLADQYDGFAVDQLTHSLQTAARAEAAGADDELVVAALCHDIGKAIPASRHSQIAGDLLQPYVRPEVTEVVRAHGQFQRRFTHHHLGGDPDARRRYRRQPWFALAERFSDEWDSPAFDPAYPTPALEHFEGRLRRVFSEARYRAASPSRGWRSVLGGVVRRLGLR